MKKPCQYITDDTQGSGVTVYVIGSGANIDHDEFKHLDRKSVRFIFADPENNKKREDKQIHQGNNSPLGTAVLSKLCGSQYGVSKKVTPVIVKVTDADGKYNFLNIIQGLISTHADILLESKRNADAKFIVIDSVHVDDVPTPVTKPVYKDFYKHAIKRLSNMDNAIFIAGAVVQEKKDQEIIYSYPSILGKTPGDYPKLLVVGGVDQSYKAIENMEDWIKTYAPANDIVTAAGLPSQYLSWDGAYIAAPAVAGILATFISKGKGGIEEALSQLDKFAYQRGSTGLHRRVVYNGVWEDAKGVKFSVPEEARTEWDEWEYDAEFCRACTESNGVQPINHVVWLPGDCPCPEAGSSRGAS
ncbi:uncharacterized protein DFL_003770 [Arthrobotrys flagrans]|uniref:Peptidase S8/S53 domain-containing protein n=1 Tax=Arthrobotrys flagrans TaxID=97331 RepID=A0A437A2T2_ARTFL|nr:hypothetical protein DFL_003770 [Arthrobotrys flagrans]